jgi:hypothetical protein
MKKPYSKLIAGREAVEAFLALVVIPCNFDCLADELQRLTAIYDMANMVKDDEIVVFGQYDSEDRLIGIIHGLYKDKTFFIHVFSVRNTNCDIAQLGLEAQAIFQERWPDIEKMVGKIPASNKASQIYARRNGFTCRGVDKNYTYVKNGKEQKILHFQKEF